MNKCFVNILEVRTSLGAIQVDKPVGSKRLELCSGDFFTFRYQGTHFFLLFVVKVIPYD